MQNFTRFRVKNFYSNFRANDENWTRDLFLTKEALYHWATPAQKSFQKMPSAANASEDYWAGDEIRTRDPQLGRLTLYQLSYSRLNYSVGRAGFEPTKA